MKLSVVIPVYRVEAFLRKCVDSVVSQEVDDMEIILVDDCSPDGSGRLCDTLACSDARIRVVHRGQNGGLSAARNSGLDVATGDCITFVDSDDFLSPGTYRACLQAMMSRQADCVEFPVMKRYGSENAEEYKPSLGEVEETFDEWYERRGYVHSYACNKIFTRRLWGDARFPEGRYFEDLFTIPYVLRRAEKIVAIASGMYYYCAYNAGAITQNPSVRNQQDLVEANVRLFEFARRDSSIADASLYDHYMEILNRQISLYHVGGGRMLPDYKVRLKYAFRRQPMRQRIKCLLRLALGEKIFFRMFVKR